MATAYVLNQKYPDHKITILEKEAVVAFHQSGRNSGVMHTGIYYKPGSLKAINCRQGKAALEAFCDTQGIEYDICGKVIVALHEGELETLENIYERGIANGVKCTLISGERLREIEPYAAGIKAIHVTEAGIVDYKQICDSLATQLRHSGHDIVTDAMVTDITELTHEVVVSTNRGDFAGSYLINCAGVYSDRLAQFSGSTDTMQIVPFRGEYFSLIPEARYLCKGLIYPVPDPQFPFLGVHFTRMISGEVECGPNAVLALAREGYHLTDINWVDFLETLRYPGFRRLAGKYWRTGLGEMWRSASKAAFVKSVRKLVPAIQEHHLETATPGIRAQAVNMNGSMMEDFCFQSTARIVNVLNAPSPAATSSLKIAESIVKRLSQNFS